MTKKQSRQKFLVRYFFGIALMIGLSQPAFPQAKRFATLIGPNENSCADWIERDRKSSQAYELWLTGFLSGLNISGDHKDDFLSGIKANSVYLWMDKYCRENPLKSIPAGALQLIEELTGKKR
jgi:hypothetical protein